MSSIKDGIIAGLKSGFIYFIIASIVNVPSHGRAAIYTIISKLEALSKS